MEKNYKKEIMENVKMTSDGMSIYYFIGILFLGIMLTFFLLIGLIR